MSNQAEQQTPTSKLEQTEQEKKYSKLQWFFFVIVIPLLFAVAIALVVMTIAGINVFDLAQKYGEKIPGISAIVSDEEQISEATENVFTLRATVEDQKVEIAKLQSEIESKQASLELSQKEIDKLMQELKAFEEQEREITLQLEELAEVYETMSAKKSAAILSEMTNEDTVEILGKMSNEARAAVLEKMEPAKAAALTKLLKPDDRKKNTDNNTEQAETAAESDVEGTDTEQ